jgi:ribosomal protein S18 acetylase RimI-like enzyme
VRGTVQKLGTADAVGIAEHFLRLDSDGLRYRFCGYTSETVIRRYVDAMNWRRQIIWGYVENGKIRGLVEIGWEFWSAPRIAELGLSVEPGWQRKKIASCLLKRSLGSAYDTLISEIRADCLSDNRAAISLLSGAGFKFRFNGSLMSGHMILDPHDQKHTDIDTRLRPNILAQAQSGQSQQDMAGAS